MIDGWNGANRDNAPPTMPAPSRPVVPPRTDNINPHGVRAGRSGPARGSRAGDLRRLDSLDSSAAEPTVLPPILPIAITQRQSSLGTEWKRNEANDYEDNEEEASADRDLEDFMTTHLVDTPREEPHPMAPVEALETLDIQPDYNDFPDEEQEEYPDEENVEPDVPDEEREEPEYLNEEREEPAVEAVEELKYEAPAQVRPPSAAAPAAQTLSQLSTGNNVQGYSAPRQYGFRDESPPAETNAPLPPMVPRGGGSNDFNPEELQRAAQQRIRDRRLADEAESKRRKDEEDAFRKRRLNETSGSSNGRSTNAITLDDAGNGSKLALLHYLKNGDNGSKKCYYSVIDGNGNKKRKRLSKQKRQMLLSLLLLDTNVGAKDTTWKGNELVRALARSAGVGVSDRPTIRGPPSGFTSQFGVISKKETAGSSLKKRQEYTPICTKLPRTKHLVCEAGDSSDSESPEDDGVGSPNLTERKVASLPKGRVPYHYCYCPGHPHEHFVNTKGRQVHASPNRITTTGYHPTPPEPTSLSQVSNTKFPLISPRTQTSRSKPPTAAFQYRPAPPSSSSSSRAPPGTAPSKVDGVQQRHTMRLDNLQQSAAEERKYWSAKYMFERQQRLAEKRVYLRELTAMWAERFDRSPYWANQIDIRVVETTKKKGKKEYQSEDDGEERVDRVPYAIPAHPLDNGDGQIIFDNSGVLKRMKLVRRRVAPSQVPQVQKLTAGMRRRSHNFTEREMIQLLEDDDVGGESSPDDIARRAILMAIKEQPDVVERRRVLAKELRQRHPRYFKVRKDFNIHVVSETPPEVLDDGATTAGRRELIMQTDEIRPGDSDWHYLYEGSSDDEEYSSADDDAFESEAPEFILVEMEADEPLEDGDEIVEFFNVRADSRPSTHERNERGKKVSFDRDGNPKEPLSGVALGTIHDGKFDNGEKKKKKVKRAPTSYKANVQHRIDGSMVVKRDHYKPPTTSSTNSKISDDYNNAAKLFGGKVRSTHRYREDIVIRYEPRGVSGSRSGMGGPSSPNNRLNYHSSAPLIEGVPTDAQDNNFLRAHYKRLHRLEDEVGEEMRMYEQEAQSASPTPTTAATSAIATTGPTKSISGPSDTTIAKSSPPLPPRSSYSVKPPMPPTRSAGSSGNSPLTHRPASSSANSRPVSAPFDDYVQPRPYRTLAPTLPLSVEEDLGLRVDPSRITAGELTRRLSQVSSGRNSSRGRSPVQDARKRQEEEYHRAQEEHAREMAEVAAEIADLERAQQQDDEADSRRKSRESRRSIPKQSRPQTADTYSSEEEL